MEDQSYELQKLHFQLQASPVCRIMPTKAVPTEDALDLLVLRLHKLGAPKLLLWMVVMIFFLEDMPQVPQAFGMVELFAGDASISKSCRYGYVSTAQLDVRMGVSCMKDKKQNSFDMASPSGLAFLSYTFSFKMVSDMVYLIAHSNSVWYND